MRVLQVSKLFPPFYGGIETVVYDLSIELKNQGHDTDVLCVSDQNVNSNEEVDGIKVYRCGSLCHLASTYLSISFVYTWRSIRNNYDVIHVHLPNPLAMIAMILFPPQGKIILHWHSDIVKQKYLKIPFLPIQKYLLDRCSKIITTSPNYAPYSLDLKAYLDKISVVPIGINKMALSSSEAVKLRLQSEYVGKKVVFSLGRHIYYKGFEYLIKSAKFLSDDYVVIIGGSGAMTEYLKKMIYDLDLTEKVFLIGKIDHNELGSYYDFCDVFCLPSVERSEAFGVVQLEAMSFGKPIISTRIQGSGVDWVNKSGISGITVEVRDPQAIASAIENIFASSFYSKNIVDYFESKFTREKMATSVINIYKEALEG
ncbi:glycosyltransferase [Vibrio vulnificus]|uniref:glycosyltransferase n=1 Tax=Vibrio vulnificus TaxID=672 RepID=UPI0024E009A2|nr:glycosyltransferase [Vibrio vulnificus]MDK2725754.1 glycosyltransferase [Vibrio vulnificus]